MTALVEVEFTVLGLPPAKDSAMSLFYVHHVHGARVLALLRAAAAATGGVDRHRPGSSTLGNVPVVLEVELEHPLAPPGDSTNYLGGIADVLEVKTHRGAKIDHLGELGAVALYDNDKQLHEVHYAWEPGKRPRYTVRVRPRIINAAGTTSSDSP